MNSLLDAILTPVLVIIFPVIITLCAHLYNLLQARLPANVKALVNEVASTVVHGVEQQFSMLSSSEKKTQALKWASSILASLGLKDIDVNFISSEIEAEVHQLNIDKEFHAALTQDSSNTQAQTQTGGTIAGGGIVITGGSSAPEIVTLPKGSSVATLSTTTQSSTPSITTPVNPLQGTTMLPVVTPGTTNQTGI
jgi:Bacteriophage holin of superfamily 6 (Holin_LLH)